MAAADSHTKCDREARVRRPRLAPHGANKAADYYFEALVPPARSQHRSAGLGLRSTQLVRIANAGDKSDVAIGGVRQLVAAENLGNSGEGEMN